MKICCVWHNKEKLLLVGFLESYHTLAGTECTSWVSGCPQKQHIYMMPRKKTLVSKSVDPFSLGSDTDEERQTRAAEKAQRKQYRTCCSRSHTFWLKWRSCLCHQLNSAAHNRLFQGPAGPRPSGPIDEHAAVPLYLTWSLPDYTATCCNRRTYTSLPHLLTMTHKITMNHEWSPNSIASFGSNYRRDRRFVFHANTKF